MGELKETIVGTGQSTNTDVDTALAEAVSQASLALSGERARFGLVFASPQLGIGRAIKAAQKAAPGVDFIGCGTAGEITERGLTTFGVSVMLIASEEMIADVAMAKHLKERPETAAARLTATFAKSEGEARRRGFPHSTTILLCDGLSPAFEEVINDLRKHTRTFQQIVGGGAGDDMALKECVVGAGTDATSNAAVVLNLFSKKALGVGVDHGLVANTPRYVVTRATNNIVQEIDGKNAYEFYVEYAKGQGVTLTESNRGAFLVEHELGLYFFEDLVKARAPLAVTPEGWLVCGGIVPEGSSACIVVGRPEKMLEAAERAAREAAEALGGMRAAGVLMFDCVCRGQILGDDFKREIECVQSVFPNVPIAGYLSYGEVARFKGRLDGYHNNTIVVVAIPA